MVKMTMDMERKQIKTCQSHQNPEGLQIMAADVMVTVGFQEGQDTAEISVH